MRFEFGVASRQPAIDDFAADVGEPEVAALVAVGELQVIEPKEVQQRGVEVVHMDGVFGNSPADFVGLAVDLATFDSATSHPE